MIHSQKYFAVIDGGGTHTRVRIAHADGKRVAELTVKQTVKFFEIGFEESARRITELIMRAAKKKNVPAKNISGVCCGLAGNGRESDQRRLRKYLSAEFQRAGLKPKRLRLESDAIIALPGLVGNNSGVVLICGTGAIAIGRTRSGDVVRVGGWGRIFGDEGSGYWLGVQALNAVARELDHRGAKTLLTEKIFKTFSSLGKREPRILRSAIALGTVRVEQIAPLVSQCAAKGDKISRAILQRAANELSDQLAAMHRKYFSKQRDVKLVLHGGVVERSSVGALLQSALKKNFPHAYKITTPAGTPLDGALRLLHEKKSSKEKV